MSKDLNTSKQKQKEASNERLAYNEILSSIDSDWKRLNEVLTDRSTSFNVDLSYRVKSGWDKYGLIDTDRENLEWRRFSLIDAFWINVIKRLRAFGFPLQAIHTLKNRLEEARVQSEFKIHILAFATIYIFDTKNTLLLHVYESGDFILTMPRDLKSNPKEDSISINLNKMLQSMLPAYDFGYLSSLKKENMNASGNSVKATHGIEDILESMKTISRKGERNG